MLNGKVDASIAFLHFMYSTEHVQDENHSKQHGLYIPIKSAWCRSWHWLWNQRPVLNVESGVKDEVEFWSCDCIVKETVWNLPEKVDHLAYKNLCVLQGSGIIKMIRNLAKSW